MKETKKKLKVDETNKHLLSSYQTPSLNDSKMAISLTQKILSELEKNFHISSLKIEYVVNKISTDKNLSKRYKEINSLPFYCYISEKICDFLKMTKLTTNNFLESLYKDLSQKKFLTVENSELTEIKNILETTNYEDLQAIEEYLRSFNEVKEVKEAEISKIEDEKEVTIIKKQGEIKVSPYKRTLSSQDSENGDFLQKKFELRNKKNQEKFGIEEIEELGNSFIRGFPDESKRSISYQGDTTINQRRSFDELFTIKKIKMKFKGNFQFKLI